MRAMGVNAGQARSKRDWRRNQIARSLGYLDWESMIRLLEEQIKSEAGG